MLINYICRARILNIYIYGTPDFKKEIHKTLIDSNIKLKLGANNLIKEIESLTALKEIIAANPKEIFLIDDSKIIKKNSFAKKVKFLTPKDAIEEEFLLNSGIADLSVDSLEEIPKYILKKYEQEKAIEELNNNLEEDSTTENFKQEIILDDDNFNINLNNNETKENIEDSETILDDELSKLLVKNQEDTTKEDIDSSIAELENLFVDDDKINSYDTSNVDFNNNFGLNNISFDYDDNSIVNDTSSSLDDKELLKSLMDIDDSSQNDFEGNFESNVEESFEDVDFLDMILNEEKNNKKEAETENLDITKELELNNLLNKIQEAKVFDEEIIKDEPKGVEMTNDDFSELDLINEKDLLDALNLEQSAQQNSFEKPIQNNNVEVLNNNSDVVNISSSNVDDLAKLFSKILNNKTLEITIKIKD